ncbi:MAG TPA: sulfite exporter TauE/SafE family protein [Blastocatellia bacterium]|nr:sulfite exporter TauE/SafE family protein [Blastocatellia bacterium]
MGNIIFHVSVAFGAAFLAGMINSVAGGGTLISFPALVWLGVDPVRANATNTLALWPGSLAGMLGFRREMADSRRWILLLGLPSLLGGVAGAALLLLTPANIFAAMVPWLILFATLIFAVGDQMNRRFRHETMGTAPSRAWWAGAMVFQFFVAVYGGYFGAGIGILMLAALGMLGLTDIHRMNGLKNFFAACINGVAAIYLAIAGAVVWPDALVMAAGAICGGYGGAGLARKLGRPFVRRVVIAVGLAMTVLMLFQRR